MAKIILRWEWRMFGSRFGAAEDALGKEPGRVEEGDELYLLSPAGSNVKVRADPMEITHCERPKPTALEPWER